MLVPSSGWSKTTSPAPAARRIVAGCWHASARTGIVVAKSTQRASALHKIGRTPGVRARRIDFHGVLRYDRRNLQEVVVRRAAWNSVAGSGQSP